MQTVIQTVSDIQSQGIFTYIKNQLTEVPEYLMDSDILNLAYYYNHSGNKITSPIIDHMTGETEQLTADQSIQLAKIILSAYKDNWDKLYRALTIDYSPIENVEEYYNETVDSTGNKTTSNTGTNKGTDNHKYGGDDTKTITSTDTNTQSGTDSTTNKGTQTNAQSGSDSTTNKGTQTNAQSGSDTTKNTGSQTNAQSGTDITKNTGTQENKNENKNGTSETVNGLAGFNSDEYNKDNKSTTTVNQTINDTRTDKLQQSTEYGRTDTRTDELSEATEYGRTDTRTDDLSEATTYGRTDTRTDDLSEATTYGRTDTRTLDNSEKTKYNNTDDETIDITNTNTGTEDTTGKDTIERHRHGNIGVTTNQYMINEEIELRKHYFNEYMFADVDKILTIPIY